MGKFRKKPVVIEAQRWDNQRADDFDALVSWCGGEQTAHGIAIETLEGTMTARPGDWIIKGVNGEFYPCKDDIFHKTYDPVVD